MFCGIWSGSTLFIGRRAHAAFPNSYLMFCKILVANYLHDTITICLSLFCGLMTFNKIMFMGTLLEVHCFCFFFHHAGETKGEAQRLHVFKVKR